MSAQVEPSFVISGVIEVRFPVFADSRGHFRETFRRSWIPDARDMVQGNTSFSRAGVLRGLHYHLKQADFWTVVSGRARAVLFDARPTSATYRRALTVDLSAAAPSGLYIPKGVAHGFYAVEDVVLSYLVDEYYDGADELGVLWNDPDLGVDWGDATASPVLSPRDAANLRFKDIPEAQRPR